MSGTCRLPHADTVAFGRWCMHQALGEHGAAASDPALAADESGQGHRPVQPQPPDGVGRVEQQPEQDAIASAGYGADDGAPAAKTRKTQAQAPEIVVGAEEADDGAEGAERAESIVSKSPTQSTASVAVEAGIEFKGVRCASVALGVASSIRLCKNELFVASLPGAESLGCSAEVPLKHIAFSKL